MVDSFPFVIFWDSRSQPRPIWGHYQDQFRKHHYILRLWYRILQRRRPWKSSISCGRTLIWFRLLKTLQFSSLSNNLDLRKYLTTPGVRVILVTNGIIIIHHENLILNKGLVWQKSQFPNPWVKKTPDSVLILWKSRSKNCHPCIQEWIRGFVWPKFHRQKFWPAGIYSNTTPVCLQALPIIWQQAAMDTLCWWWWCWFKWLLFRGKIMDIIMSSKVPAWTYARRDTYSILPKFGLGFFSFKKSILNLTE